MSKSVNTMIGIVLAVLSCGILIYAFETGRSLFQIIIAFLILFLPITFISSINGKLTIFIFSSIIVISGYIIYKQEWYDTGLGFILALLLGSATHIFKISKAETFSATNYQQEQKDKRDA